MILTMAYLLVIAALLGVAALPGERLIAELGLPRRAVWLAAMSASVVLPAYAIFFVASESAGAPILSLPQLPDFVPAFNGPEVDAVGAGVRGSPSFIWPEWQAFNASLIVIWVISSVALLLLSSLAGFRLRRIVNQSQAMAIGDQEVLLSDSLGPAVLGLLSPRIVLPRWLAERESALRTFVLNHEREHIAARDQLSVFAALLIVALMPWNIALWWQLHRLRHAIEVDCDTRVLRSGANAHEYSEALLTVGRKSLRAPFASLALTEPVSQLENRIRIILAHARKFNAAICGARALIVLSVLGLAIAVNAPNAQQAANGEAAASSRVIPTIRTEIYDRLTEAQACLEGQDPVCAMEILDAVRAREDLGTYETAQLYNFYAFVHFEMDMPEEAAVAYETILTLPLSEIPDGLVSGAMRNLATLYVQLERYQDGLDLFERRMALPAVTAGANDFYLIATILYQMERYEDAIEPLERAIAESEEPREEHYQLLYVLNFQIDDQAGVLRALETLNERWPSDQWTRALENAGRQAAASEAAADLDVAIRPAEPGLRAESSDYLPIVHAPPVYPQQAAARELEGYAVVSYTITATGTTKDFEVIESSDGLFDNASIASVEKYKYRPRIVDGRAVEVPGVTTRIVFELEGSDD